MRCAYSIHCPCTSRTRPDALVLSTTPYPLPSSLPVALRCPNSLPISPGHFHCPRSSVNVSHPLSLPLFTAAVHSLPVFTYSLPPISVRSVIHCTGPMHSPYSQPPTFAISIVCCSSLDDHLDLLCTTRLNWQSDATNWHPDLPNTRDELRRGRQAETLPLAHKRVLMKTYSASNICLTIRFEV